MPLEGMSDVYRETLCRGGVPYTPFWDFVANNLFGEFPFLLSPSHLNAVN